MTDRKADGAGPALAATPKMNDHATQPIAPSCVPWGNFDGEATLVQVAGQWAVAAQSESSAGVRHYRRPAQKRRNIRAYSWPTNSANAQKRSQFHNIETIFYQNSK